MNDVWFALGLTLFAGMATGIGSAVAFTAKRTNYRFLSSRDGLLRGCDALCIVCRDLRQRGHLPDGGLRKLLGPLGERGLLLRRHPSHRSHRQPDPGRGKPPRNPFGRGNSAPSRSLGPPSRFRRRAQGRPGRGYPWGPTTMAPTTGNSCAWVCSRPRPLPSTTFPRGWRPSWPPSKTRPSAWPLPWAIALHNIPEGISVSVPIFFATGNRRKAFLYSVLSGPGRARRRRRGLHPAQGLRRRCRRGYPPAVHGDSLRRGRRHHGLHQLDELLPTSRAYGKGHDSLLGLLTGMLVMA